MAAKAALDAKQKKVLKALGGMSDPATNKQIAGAAGLESQDVTAAIKKLKDAGFVDSPARCKYGLTPSGKKAV
ncbi:MAG: MarR family winged helix-turn-helix transcriptional regulator [Proteobacteria bacterium]|nr:MarR family winged helix-turn-helix transcriptional regulator [Pseudomonadota bacterium]MBU1741090.1 MarR family winged helix-turn-helix transcriptional regulator [Pseudomonadota bacterium]